MREPYGVTPADAAFGVPTRQETRHRFANCFQSLSALILFRSG